MPMPSSSRYSNDELKGIEADTPPEVSLEQQAALRAGCSLKANAAREASEEGAMEAALFR
eukprot:scaffold53988_cov61-Phaeocystis_antarctica.AAC.1